MEVMPEKKAHDSTPAVCKKAHVRLWDHEAKDSVVWWDENGTLRPECKALHLAETEHSSSPIEHHPHLETWWWQHTDMGMLFSGSDWGTFKDRGNNEWSQNAGKSSRRTCFGVQKTFGCGEDLHSNGTMIPNTQPKQHWNGFRTRKWKCLSGPTKGQTWIPLIIICGKTWRLLFTDTLHTTWQNLSKSERKNGRKSPNPDVQSWYRQTHEDVKL